jgi:hypothetical protein
VLKTVFKKWCRIGWKNICKLWIEEWTPEQLKGEGNGDFNIKEISETIQQSPRFMYKLHSYSSSLVVCAEKKPQSISSWISGGSFISSKLLLLLHMG